MAADRIKVQHVVVNLICNCIAAKLEPPECMKRRLCIIKAARPRGNSAVDTSVGDTCSGIYAQVWEKLFQSFVSTKSDGMGFGLSVSRSSVEMHCGLIWTERRPKSGTRIAFTLSVDDKGGKTSMENQVYVVDDDAAVRDSLEALLLAEGFQTRTFGSGEDFLKAFDPGEAACVLLDVRMPGTDGLSVLEALGPSRSATPVIVLSGHADVPMAVRAMRAGAEDFIEKPFAAAHLLKHVHGAVARKRRSAQVPRTDEDRFAALTPREREVMEQLVIGLPNKLIAHTLGMSPRTVEIHRSRVMQKTGAESLSHLVRMAIRAGIDPEK